MRTLTTTAIEYVDFAPPDLGTAEIAEVVGCLRSTAKSRFRYGLRKLRMFLTEQSEAQR